MKDQAVFVIGTSIGKWRFQVDERDIRCRHERRDFAERQRRIVRREISRRTARQNITSPANNRRLMEAPGEILLPAAGQEQNSKDRNANARTHLEHRCSGFIEKPDALSDHGWRSDTDT